jgi:hypothetical protein
MSAKATKTRMAQLARELNMQKEDIQFPKSDRGKQIGDIPARGERGDFRKLTATLPAELYEKVLAHVLERKLSQQPNADLSSIIREALLLFFQREGN